MIVYRYFLAILTLLLLNACISDHHDGQYGIQQGHTHYVPARIAVLDCRLWPQGARFQGLALSNTSPEVQDQLCEAYNKFVLKGFTNQPYMRGLSPQAVKAALNKSQGPMFLNSIDQHWQHKNTDCTDCTHLTSFYRLSIADRLEWRQWLSTLSKSVRNADAVLMPFLLYSNERHYKDRGVQVMTKQAMVGLLLVDTNNGYLLWAGGREAEISNQAFAATGADNDQADQSPAGPQWSDLFQRLLTDNIWRDFPGRQTY